MVLDNLEVRGKAKLDATNLNILVQNGDLSSNDSISFVQDGTIKANVVDVNGAAWTATANESGSVISNRCAGAGSTITVNCP